MILTEGSIQRFVHLDHLVPNVSVKAINMNLLQDHYYFSKLFSWLTTLYLIIYPN